MRPPNVPTHDDFTVGSNTVKLECVRRQLNPKRRHVVRGPVAPLMHESRTASCGHIVTPFQKGDGSIPLRHFSCALLGIWRRHEVSVEGGAPHVVPRWATSNMPQVPRVALRLAVHPLEFRRLYRERRESMRAPAVRVDYPGDLIGREAHVAPERVQCEPKEYCGIEKPTQVAALPIEVSRPLSSQYRSDAAEMPACRRRNDQRFQAIAIGPDVVAAAKQRMLLKWSY
jgi:hypothetical protein